MNLMKQTSVNSIAQKILRNQCLLEDKIRQNTIQLATCNSSFGVIIKAGTRGWILSLVGELKRCIDIRIQIRPQSG
jgi:hypothetical protein